MTRTTETYTLRLPRMLKARIEELARALEKPVSVMIRDVLREWAETQPADPVPARPRRAAAQRAKADALAKTAPSPKGSSLRPKVPGRTRRGLAGETDTAATLDTRRPDAPPRHP